MVIKHESIVEEYEFQSLSGVMKPKSRDISSFELNEFSSQDLIEQNVGDDEIRRERNAESQSAFEISSVVKEDRGLNAQAQRDFEERVAVEVEKQLALIKEDAYQKGYSSGEEKGHQKAQAQAMMEYEDRVNRLNDYIDSVLSFKKDIMDKQRKEIYQMVRTISKWVLMREIKDDGYLTALIEKLIMELHTQTDLLIKVDEGSFDSMPKALEIVQEKLGELSNVRLEIARDLGNTGIIIESKNGMIDGSIEAQFKSIDKIFEEIGVIDER